jgi:hypothetical protein
MTRDGGRHWSDVKLPTSANQDVYPINGDPPSLVDGRLMLGAAVETLDSQGIPQGMPQTNLFASGDRGTSWALAGTPPGFEQRTATSVNFVDATTWVVRGDISNDGGPSVLVVVTTDAGGSWRDAPTTANGGLQQVEFAGAAVGWARSALTGYASLEAQSHWQRTILLRTGNLGRTWERVGP